jgi:hypothetical protein
MPWGCVVPCPIRQEMAKTRPDFDSAQPSPDMAALNAVEMRLHPERGAIAGHPTIGSTVIVDR